MRKGRFGIYLALATIMKKYPNASEQFELYFYVEFIHTELCTTFKQSWSHCISEKATEKIIEEAKQALANSTEKEDEYFAGIR